MSEENVSVQDKEPQAASTAADSETDGAAQEPSDEEHDFERRNIVGFIIGFIVLVIGMITLGTGSTTLSPFLIIGGYFIIGLFLFI